MFDRPTNLPKASKTVFQGSQANTMYYTTLLFYNVSSGKKILGLLIYLQQPQKKVASKQNPWGTFKGLREMCSAENELNFYP